MLPEALLPQPVDHHTRGERIVTADKPSGHAGAVARDTLGPAGQSADAIRLDLGPFLVPGAAQQHMGGTRLLALGQHHDIHRLARLGLGQLPLGARQGLARRQVGFVSGQKLLKEALAQRLWDIGTIHLRQIVERRGTGGARRLTDLIGGQTPAWVGPLGDIERFAAAGKARILATTGEKRSKFVPNVPTFFESDCSASSWSSKIIFES